MLITAFLYHMLSCISKEKLLHDV